MCGGGGGGGGAWFVQKPAMWLYLGLQCVLMVQCAQTAFRSAMRAEGAMCTGSYMDFGPRLNGYYMEFLELRLPMGISDHKDFLGHIPSVP